MKICVLGSGTWGSAISNLLALKGKDVFCYSHRKEQADLLNSTHLHKNLPGAILSSKIVFSSDLDTCLKDSEVIVFATPSTYIRKTAEQIKPYYHGQLIIDLAKGVEENSLLTTSEIIEDVLKIKDEVVALTGPTHAEEVVLSLPTCIVAACKNIENAKKTQEIFHGDSFRVYTNEDRKGCELCGAFKNIIAIACGISDGLGFGDNAKAALITRGVHELRKLGVAMGCDSNTFSGLAGLGDLVVTCTSKHSRNNQAGNYIGQGFTPQEAVDKVGMVVEGILSLNAAKELCDKYQIDMPIIYGVHEIIIRNKGAKEIAQSLLSRDKKNEFFN